jgi:hypothetical protein
MLLGRRENAQSLQQSPKAQIEQRDANPSGRERAIEEVARAKSFGFSRGCYAVRDLRDRRIYLNRVLARQCIEENERAANEDSQWDALIKRKNAQRKPRNRNQDGEKTNDKEAINKYRNLFVRRSVASNHDLLVF